MKELIFKNGDVLPMLGLGTWQSAKGEVYKAVREAIRLGYRNIDCAAIYANEDEIGQAFNDAFAEEDVKREDMFVTSKLWNNRHAQEDVVPALRQTLSDLKLDYLDLYLVHWPVALKRDMTFARQGADYISLEELPISETWAGMEACVDEGLAKHIGVSNFSVTKLKDILEYARIRPEMNQVELHPFLQQNDLFDFCKLENIFLTAYSPLGSPGRTPEMKADNEPDLLGYPTIVEIAKKHSCSAAQVLVRWAIQRGTAVIPKTVNPTRLKENFECLKIDLTDEDMKKIADMDRHFRYVNGLFNVMEGSPYTYANTWDE